jgi:hypothetical protein
VSSPARGGAGCVPVFFAAGNPPVFHFKIFTIILNEVKDLMGKALFYTLSYTFTSEDYNPLADLFVSFWLVVA